MAKKSFDLHSFPPRFKGLAQFRRKASYRIRPDPYRFLHYAKKLNSELTFLSSAPIFAHSSP